MQQVNMAKPSNKFSQDVMLTDKYSSSVYPTAIKGTPQAKIITKARLFICVVFLIAKDAELNKLKTLTRKVVAVKGMTSNKVKLDTTMRPKPNPLSV